MSATISASATAVLCGLLVALSACTPVVGDKCTYNSQCGTTLTCDTTFQDGYCIKVGCRKGECPAEATCVDFGFDTRWCMRSCAPDNECRSGLVCRSATLCADGSTPSAEKPCTMEGNSFCGVAP